MNTHRNILLCSLLMQSREDLETTVDLWFCVRYKTDITSPIVCVPACVLLCVLLRTHCVQVVAVGSHVDVVSFQFGLD